MPANNAYKYQTYLYRTSLLQQQDVLTREVADDLFLARFPL